MSGRKLSRSPRGLIRFEGVVGAVCSQSGVTEDHALNAYRQSEEDSSKWDVPSAVEWTCLSLPHVQLLSVCRGWCDEVT